MSFPGFEGNSFQRETSRRYQRWQNGLGLSPVVLVDAVDNIRTVPPAGEIVRVGRALGISFGGG